MKILIIDSAYPDFLRTLPPLNGTYDEELAKYMDRGFGTFDAYSHYLRALGHEVVDVIANYMELQQLWPGQRLWTVMEQIVAAKPDVVFMQDLSLFDASTLRLLASKYLLAGQTSCRLPSIDRVEQFHVLFSSFPFYPELLRGFGVRWEYLPLAFDPRMRPPERIRDLDISFVGGVGAQSHWKHGTETLEAVAAAFPERFHWYGYGIENLDSNSPLRKCFRGPAWGRDQYEVYARSKCVVNRHGEVAQGFSNNLRMYEATGCGAMLLTETSFNVEDLFPRDTIATYSNVPELLEKIRYFLEHDAAREFVARLGQLRTLTAHTYAQRMPIVSAVVSEVLESRKVSA